jgi:hypothetical protein
LAGADVNSKSFGQGTEISHGESPLHAAAQVFTLRLDDPAAENESNSATGPVGHNQVRPESDAHELLPLNSERS